MQINRLFEIVLLLLDRQRVTATELADRFEVSKRTILRDIDILSAAGIPVYTIRGRGGGIALLPGYVLNKTALTGDEQDQILMALQSLSATGSDTKEIRQKLGALFRRESTDWIEVDFSSWGQGISENERFSLLRQSILGGKSVIFTYVSAYGEESEREVYPLKLVFKSRAWYLQGFCLVRRAYRTFRLSRILHLCPGESDFERTSFSPPPLEENGAAPESHISLELVFPGSLAFRVYDIFDGGSIERGEEGELHVSVRMPEDEWLYAMLLSFGDAIQIINPPELNAVLHRKKQR